MKRYVILLMIGLLGWSGVSFGAVATIPVDVTGQVQVSKSGLVYNRVTKTFNSTLTLTNTSQAPIYGPITISVIVSDPTNVSLANSAGLSITGSYPTLTIASPNGILSAGASVSNILLKFNNAKQITFAYNLDLSANLDPSTQGTATITSLSADFGPTGTVVTINGTGFTKTSKVYFGNKTLSNPTIISDKQIEIMVPFDSNSQGQLIALASGLYPFKVDNSISYNFTVTALPANPNPAGKVMNTVVSSYQQAYNNRLSQYKLAIDNLSISNTDPATQQVITKLYSLLDSTTNAVSLELSNTAAALDPVSLDTLERVYIVNQLHTLAPQLVVATNTGQVSNSKILAKNSLPSLQDLQAQISQSLISALMGKNAYAASITNADQWLLTRKGANNASKVFTVMSNVGAACSTAAFIVPSAVVTGPIGITAAGAFCATIALVSSTNNIVFSLLEAGNGTITSLNVPASVNATGSLSATSNPVDYFFTLTYPNDSGYFSQPTITIGHTFSLTAFISDALGIVAPVMPYVKNLPVNNSINNTSNGLTILNAIVNLPTKSVALSGDEGPFTIGIDKIDFTNCANDANPFLYSYATTYIGLTQQNSQEVVTPNTTKGAAYPANITCVLDVLPVYKVTGIDAETPPSAHFKVLYNVPITLTKLGGDGLVNIGWYDISGTTGNTIQPLAPCPVGCATDNLQIPYHAVTNPNPALIGKEQVVFTAQQDLTSSTPFTGWSGASATACKEDPQTSLTCTITINDNTPISVTANYSTCNVGSNGPAGGIIFYCDSTGIHGLEAAPVDQAQSTWGCWSGDNTIDSWFTFTAVGGTSPAIGAGAANTAAIMAACGTSGTGNGSTTWPYATATNAAATASAYTLNGYSDWYLPSKDELAQLYLHKDVVGGFVWYFYWSSTEEVADSDVWYHAFDNGIQYSTYKAERMSVGLFGLFNYLTFKPFSLPQQAIIF